MVSLFHRATIKNRTTVSSIRTVTYCQMPRRPSVQMYYTNLNAVAKDVLQCVITVQYSRFSQFHPKMPQKTAYTQAYVSPPTQHHIHSFATWDNNLYRSYFSELLWPPYVIGQAIVFLHCGFFLSFFFHRLISAAADQMSTILRHMVWSQCEFRMQV